MAERRLVLITRTEEAGKVLTEKVRAMDLEAIHCAPFALAAPEKPARVAAQLETLLPADRVIITSQEGVRRAIELVGANAFSRSLVIVPGERTAALARELGIDNVICPSCHGTSEAMLALPELVDVEGLDILILAAEGGRGLMGEVLRRRNASVERVHVYRRIRQSMPGNLEKKVSAASSLFVLAASWEAVSGLCESAAPEILSKIRDAVLIAPSRRVGEKAATLGFARVAVAAGADDEAMLGQLRRLTANRS